MTLSKIISFKAVAFVLVLSSILYAEQPWQFMMVGDSRSNSSSTYNGVNVPILSEIADEAVRHGVDFIIFPGDLVNGGVDQTQLQSQLTTWVNTMQPVYDAGIGLYPVRGNHELGNPQGTAAWENVFSGSLQLPQNGPDGEKGFTYSVSHKNVFVLALDQYINKLRVNQNWVDQQLAANELPHVVAFGHVPAFKVHHSDCLDDYVSARDAFWQSLKNAGCRVYACGHDHFYDHAVISDGNTENDIHQYLVGTGGAPLRSWSPPYDGYNSNMSVEQWHHVKQFGYVLVDVVDDNELKMVWYGRDPATGEYSAPVSSADIDNDNVVGINDLLLFSGKWLEENCRVTNNFCDGADINQLTTVDIVDFNYFAQKWLLDL